MVHVEDVDAAQDALDRGVHAQTYGQYLFRHCKFFLDFGINIRIPHSLRLNRLDYSNFNAARHGLRINHDLARLLKSQGLLPRLAAVEEERPQQVANTNHDGDANKKYDQKHITNAKIIQVIPLGIGHIEQPLDQVTHTGKRQPHRV